MRYGAKEPPGDVRHALRAERSRQYDVRWAKTVGLETLDQAGAQLAHGDPESFGELQRNGETVRPSNCLEWGVLHGKDFEAVSTIEAQTDSGAKLRCGTLELLRRARPAQISHVRDLRWNESLLPLLPSIIATAVSRDEERALAAAMKEGKSLIEYVPSVHLRATREPEVIEVLEGDGTWMVIVRAEAWGDFNADGTDDLVVSVINGATQGTYSTTRLMTLTRSNDVERLRLVSVQ